MAKIDIHNTKKRTERAKINLQKKFPDVNAKTVCRFLDRLRLDIRISGIEFEKDFVRIHTTGKTGPKSLTLVASFGPIREWLAEHPHSDDPDAFLFYHDNADGLIPYQRMTELIRTTRHISGIKKRIWPYLFRHTALTEYSKKLIQSLRNERTNQ